MRVIIKTHQNSTTVHCIQFFTTAVTWSRRSCLSRMIRNLRSPASDPSLKRSGPMPRPAPWEVSLRSVIAPVTVRWRTPEPLCVSSLVTRFEQKRLEIPRNNTWPKEDIEE
ncbi:hypothetical protein GJAV_G00199540 [Gymnothorax javanicus]|nr:hypothetical protein GJAV_G00199540 [Gymnothorax javanicus]